jgi:hypothetical protein
MDGRLKFSHFDLVPYDVVAEKLPCKSKMTARRQCILAVARFVRAYNPELGPAMAERCAANGHVQATIREYIEQALANGAEWPT